MNPNATTLPALAHTETVGARLRAMARGRQDDARWIRPAVAAMLALAGVLCLWGLSRSGYSNTYYAAAVKSASESWKAWFFGSLDPGSFITVDKPPLALWLMGLSARLFGFSSWSMLLPQALCAIASVGLLYATVRRAFGPAAGVIAGTALALTPIAVAVARVNNPDALLVALMVGAAWLLMRALETGRTGPLACCGAIVGLAFMTKMLQGWMVVPAFASAYLVAGPPRLATRIRQLALAAAAMVAVSAAWPLAVTLWPGSKPYIGGSGDGSVWNLILGYNGLGRIFGASEGGQGASFGGSPGIWRMLNAQVGGQIAWLLPFAAISLVAGLWLTRRAARTDRARAGFILFGLWALVHVTLFSYQKGIFHPYYVSALAPAVAALTGAGAVMLMRWARDSWRGVVVLDEAIVGSAAMAVALLDRVPTFAPALRLVIPAAAIIAVLASIALRIATVGRTRAALVALFAAGAIAVASGPAAYSVATSGRALNGNNVLAGPQSASAGLGMGAGPGIGTRAGGPSGGGAAGRPPSGSGAAGPPSGARPSAAPAGASGTVPQAGRGGAGSSASAPSARAGGAGRGAMGGSISSTTIAYLKAHRGSAKYLLAAEGSQTTASVILATGLPVVTIGGFSGSDPAPTVSQLAAMVKAGELRYVLVGSGMGGGPGGSGDQALTAWIEAHGKAVSGAGVSSGTLYRVS